MATIHNHSQALKDLPASLTSKADNEQICGLQQVVDKLQSYVATTSLIDLHSTIDGLSTSVTNLSFKVDTQNGLLTEMLTQLKAPPQPSPSFTAEDQMILQMGEKNAEEKSVEEKNAEDPPQAEGEKETEKGLVINDEEDESTFIPITNAQRTEPT
ncbi:hypothetical protein L6452_18596 [Arctium lappa]|uniref:Uncharacterized protein n=1 Tax=Arctium lappa TaxID=4217 RepID=A0ACB9C6P0_ARCLA|nr:hypothetical protein L6452_18596 [Arctium lappa]